MKEEKKPEDEQVVKLCEEIEPVLYQENVRSEEVLVDENFEKIEKDPENEAVVKLCEENEPFVEQKEPVLVDIDKNFKKVEKETFGEPDYETDTTAGTQQSAITDLGPGYGVEQVCF